MSFFTEIRTKKRQRRSWNKVKSRRRRRDSFDIRSRISLTFKMKGRRSLGLARGGICTFLCTHKHTQTHAHTHTHTHTQFSHTLFSLSHARTHAQKHSKKAPHPHPHSTQSQICVWKTPQNVKKLFRVCAVNNQRRNAASFAARWRPFQQRRSQSSDGGIGGPRVIAVPRAVLLSFAAMRLAIVTVWPVVADTQTRTLQSTTTTYSL